MPVPIPSKSPSRGLPLGQLIGSELMSLYPSPTTPELNPNQRLIRAVVKGDLERVKAVFDQATENPSLAPSPHTVDKTHTYASLHKLSSFDDLFTLEGEARAQAVQFKRILQFLQAMPSCSSLFNSPNRSRGAF